MPRSTTQNSASTTPAESISAQPSATREPLLQVDNLHVDFQTYGGVVQAVRGVAGFDVAAGQTLAIVGNPGAVSPLPYKGLMGMPPGRIHRHGDPAGSRYP